LTPTAFSWAMMWIVLLLLAALMVSASSPPHHRPAPQAVQAPCITPDGTPMSAWETAPHGTICPRTWQDL
jgi:hypothetical protein